MAAVLFFAVSVILFAAIVEILLGCAYYYIRYGKSYYKMRFPYFIFCFDRLCGYRLRPNLKYSNPGKSLPTAPRRVTFVDVRTDRSGFLCREQVKEMVESVIFCLGDSTTAGIEVDSSSHYPARLDALLGGKGLRCVNAAVGGYRSVHELIRFKTVILSYHPRAVIVFAGYNDFEDYAQGFWEPGNPFRNCLSHMLPQSRWESAVRATALGNLVWRVLGQKKMAKPPSRRFSNLEQAIGQEDWIEEWRRNIGEIAATCRARNIPCFLLGYVTPVFDDAPEEAVCFADTDVNMAGRWQAYVDYVHLMNQVCRDVSKANGAVFVDALSRLDAKTRRDDSSIDFRRRNEYFIDRFHFSELGHKFVAELLYDAISGHCGGDFGLL